MVDIVDRLRDLFCPSGDQDARDEDRLALEAAEEIAKLRIELNKWQTDCLDCEGKDAEIERLRDDLEVERQRRTETVAMCEQLTKELDEAHVLAKKLLSFYPDEAQGWWIEGWPWLKGEE